MCATITELLRDFTIHCDEKVLENLLENYSKRFSIDLRDFLT